MRSPRTGMPFIAAALSASAALCLAAEPRHFRHGPLRCEEAAGRITVTGDHFRMVWDSARGGGLTEIHLSDWTRWRRVTPEGRSAAPLEVAAKAGPFGPDFDKAAGLRIAAKSDERVVIEAAATLANDKGAALPVRVKRRFHVYDDGVVFCDLAIEVTGRAELDGAALSFRVHPKLVGDATVTGVLRGNAVWVRYGTKSRPITNHIAFGVENPTGIGGGKVTKQLLRTGKDLSGAKMVLLAGPAKLPAGQVYKTRWFIDAGRVVRSGKLLGARIYHWGGGGAKWPTDEMVDKMAAHGCNVLCIHLDKRWGADRKRVIERAHRNGIRVLIYVNPGRILRGGARNQIMREFGKWLKRDHDGLYYDHWGNLHKTGAIDPKEKNEYLDMGPIMAGEVHKYSVFHFYKYARAVRKMVGPDGLLIVHQGYGVGTSQVDGALTGEGTGPTFALTGKPVRIAEDGATVVYEKGSFTGILNGAFPTWSISCIWMGGRGGRQYQYDNARTAAYFAGLGGMTPDLVLGSGSYTPGQPVDPEKAFPAYMPLWQMWRTVPMHEATLYNHATEKAVTASDPNIYACAYHAGGKGTLVIAANLATLSHVSATLTVDAKRLGLTGDYKVLEMRAKDFQLWARELPAGPVKPIKLEKLPACHYVGYLYAPGKFPPQARAYLKKAGGDPAKWFRVW